MINGKVVMGRWIENWFSNFLPNDKPFIYQGMTFYTVENFFQAMKTLDIEERKLIAAATPSKAKRLGRKVKLREDWEEKKLQVMEYALRIKFAPGTSWYTKLMATGNEEIVELNNWNDVYWGRTLDGRGENHLGNLLIKLREEYKSNNE
jgi:ribA/ribD-fused uncharacterized protein